MEDWRGWQIRGLFQTAEVGDGGCSVMNNVKIIWRDSTGSGESWTGRGENVLCIENSDPTSPEQMGASYMCPEADVPATIDGRSVGEKTLQNTEFCSDTSAFLHCWSCVMWMQKSWWPFQGQLCFRVISLLVISGLCTAVIEAHTIIPEIKFSSVREDKTSHFPLSSIPELGSNEKKPQVSGTNPASCGGFFFSFPLCMANSQFQVSKCSF